MFLYPCLLPPLVSPISNIAGALDRMRSKIVCALEALKETKDGRETQSETPSAGTDVQDGRTDEIKTETAESAAPNAGETGTEKATEDESSNNQNKKEESSDG